MGTIYIPEGYKSPQSVKDTEILIKEIKQKRSHWFYAVEQPKHKRFLSIIHRMTPYRNGLLILV